MATLLAMPTVVLASTEDLVGRYANARVAEIGQQDEIAFNTYLKLYNQVPTSDVLADRLFDSAMRTGDMAIAVRAARAKELRNGGNNETALLLFADAWRAKNWDMAELAADELAVGGNLVFMAPLLKAWVNVAQGKNAALPGADPEVDGFFAYYSADQRIYLDLASGDVARAKLGLRNIAGQSGEHVRDIMIAAAETFGQNGNDSAFAEALMRSAVGSSEGLPKRSGKMPAERGISALYARIATTLIEQDLPKEGLVLARIGAWIAPTRPNVRLALARALNANALTSEALASLERVEPASPYHASALANRVDILIATGEFERVQEIIGEALATAPNSIANKTLRARAWQAGGDLPAAISAYRDLIASADFEKLPIRQQAAYRMLLASAFDRVGDWQSAKAELENILVVDANNAEALNYLGYSLLERGEERDRATALVERAYALVPTSSAITDSLGWAYFLKGDAAKALPLLEKAAKGAGPDAAINEHLGDAYWTLGRRREARYAWRVASQGSEGDVAVRLAQKIDTGLSNGTR